MTTKEAIETATAEIYPCITVGDATRLASLYANHVALSPPRKEILDGHDVIRLHIVSNEYFEGEDLTRT